MGGGVMTQQIKGMKRKAGGEEAPNHMTPRVRKGSVRRGNRHVEVPEQNKIGRTESDKKDECKVANQGQDSVQKGGGKGLVDGAGALSYRQLKSPLFSVLS